MVELICVVATYTCLNWTMHWYIILTALKVNCIGKGASYIGSFSFDLLKIGNSPKCWVWAIYDITLSVKKIDRYRGFTYILKQAKTVFFSLYNLSGRIHHFFCKSTLHINGFSDSDQFDSICLDYAYQLVD